MKQNRNVSNNYYVIHPQNISFFYFMIVIETPTLNNTNTHSIMLLVAFILIPDSKFLHSTRFKQTEKEKKKKKTIKTQDKDKV